MPFTKTILLVLSVGISMVLAKAQNAPCATPHVSELSPEKQDAQFTLDQQLAALKMEATSQSKAERTVLTIPVKWHVFHEGLDGKISEARIDSAMAWLNEAFRAEGYYNNGLSEDVQIEFCRAKRDPQGRPSTGANYVRSDVLRTYLVFNNNDISFQNGGYDPNRYLNIYSHRFVASLGGLFAGLAYFPTDAGEDFDGVYMDNNYVGTTRDSSAILAHEVGHYLGLFHTFQDGCRNNDCTMDGDRICDTPPDLSRTYGDCDTPENSCTTDANSGFSSDQDDRSDNYMDYREFSCMRAFTADQATRMRDVLTTVRSGLLDNSDACTAPDSSLELCDNNYDDDGDGLIDCADADCNCVPIAGCTPDSIADFTQFALREAWHTTRSVVPGSQPIVGPLDIANPNHSNIVVTRNNQFMYVFAGDGSSDEFNPPTLFADTDLPLQSGAPSVVDLEGDGVLELIVPSLDLLTTYATYSADSSPVMKTLDMFRTTDILDDVPVQFADFDQDGKAELYQLTTIFTRERPSYNAFPPFIDSLSAAAVSKYSSFAADVLSVSDCNGDAACNGLELIDGPNVYSVDLNERFGGISNLELRYSVADQIPAFAKTTNTVVADLNADGIPEIITAYSERVLIYNTAGLFLEIPFVASAQQDKPSRPCVAEVYDERRDGFSLNLPELIIATPGFLNCYSLNTSGVGVRTVWQIPTADEVGRTAPVAFDFDANGTAEIVYRGLDSLKVIYGGTRPFPSGVADNRTIVSQFLPSQPSDTYPVIADVDHDGQAEIIVTGGETTASDMRLFVFEADLQNGNPWAPTRRFWNTYGYNYAHINDDLTVPTHQQNSWLEVLNQGSNNRVFNTVGVNLPRFNEEFDPILSSADLAVTFNSISCDTSSAGTTLNVEFLNLGDRDIAAGMPFSIFRGDPRIPGAVRVFDGTISGPQLAGTRQGYIESIPSLTAGLYYLVINLDPNANVPISLTNDRDPRFQECAVDNNIISFTYTGGVPLLVDLGEDLTVCFGEPVRISPSQNFEQYLWSDNSISAALSPQQSGVYWLEATDVCGNVSRDSIEVAIVQPQILDLGEDRSVCDGDSVLIEASGFATYTWSGTQPPPCTSCEGFELAITSSASFFVQATDTNGCEVLDSISFTPFPLTTPDLGDDVDACFGESLSFTLDPFEGYTWAGVYGCDTCQQGEILVVQDTEVSVLVEDINGCFGSDTVQVELINQPEIIIGIDSADCAIDGLGTISISSPDLVRLITSFADSISSLTLTDVPQGSYEIATSYLGCLDTLIVVMPEVNENVTEEFQRICEVDLPLSWRGNTILDTGIYEQRVQQLDACDSVYRLNVVPIADTSFSFVERVLCPGDTFSYRGVVIDSSTSLTFQLNTDQYCPDIEQFTATNGELVSLRLPMDTSVFRGQAVSLQATTSDTTGLLFQWMPEEFFSCSACAKTSFRASENVTISVTATSLDGCITSSSAEVSILEGTEIFIPNAFSPNDDGINDLFTLYSGGSVERIISFQVFSRNGNRVFSRNNFAPNLEGLGWDGMLNGRRLNPQVLAYIIEVEDREQGTLLFEGDVSLIR